MVTVKVQPRFQRTARGFTTALGLILQLWQSIRNIPTIGSRDITKKRMIIVFGIDSMGDGERGVTQPHTYRAGSR